MESTILKAARQMSDMHQGIVRKSLFDQEYDALPECVKMAVTRKEFAWMPPERRCRLEEEMTTPEYEGE